MYYWLSREIKRRFADELRRIFVDYPTLEKFTVHDHFPYGERVQFGIIFKNVSGDPIPLSADNFITTTYSHVFTARVKDKKGLIFDWVREDEIITVLTKADLSAQANGTNKTFVLPDQPVSGNNDTTPATSPRQVVLYVNGVRTPILELTENSVIIQTAPPAGAKVHAEYFKSRLVAPGLYYFEVTKDLDDTGHYEVMVDSLLDEEINIIKSATGSETTYQLPNHPVHKGTFYLYESGTGSPHPLREGKHYTFDYESGLITFLPNPDDPSETLIPGRSYTVTYRYQGQTQGPFKVTKLQTRPEILPGVTLAFSNWLHLGDKQVVIVTKHREDAAKEYGGKFDLSITLDVYSRDPLQREFVADLVVVKLFGELKPKFDGQGLLIVRVTPTGETEDIYDENTDTPYFMAGIDISVQADWAFYQPLVPKIRHIGADLVMVPSPNDFKVAFIPQHEDIRG